MKTIFTKKQVSVAATACALVLTFATGIAQAQRAADPLPGQASPDQDRQTWTELRNQVWLNTYGQCWRSYYGPAGEGECNPRPVAQYIAPPPPPVVQPAPVVVQPAPAPAPIVAPEPMPRKRDRN